MRTRFQDGTEIINSAGTTDPAWIFADSPYPVRKFYVLANGMTVAFDVHGSQVVEVQGPLHEIVEAARKWNESQRERGL